MSEARAKRVLLIVFDYMGYADIEPFGSSEIKTPNIRRLAEDGRRYTDFYAAAPICVPSRAAMLTGRYPRRLGIEENIYHGEPGLPTSEKTLARYFQDAGTFHNLPYWCLSNKSLSPKSRVLWTHPPTPLNSMLRKFVYGSWQGRAFILQFVALGGAKRFNIGMAWPWHVHGIVMAMAWQCHGMAMPWQCHGNAMAMAMAMPW